CKIGNRESKTDVGWPTGLEPATTRTTIWGSTIELRPPSIRCRRASLRFASRFAKNKDRYFDLLPSISRHVQRRIASSPSSIIIAPRRRMKEIGSVLLAGFFFLLAAGYLRGQQDDPSEIFLKAYLSAQQGEKLEHENRFNTALAKYRFAGSLIAQLRRSHPGWQPAIVEYRGRKISEGILRTQARMTKQNALGASANPLPEIAPSLPESEDWSEPGPEVVARQSDGTVTETSRDAAIRDATKKLRGEVDQLQTALEKARSDF